jgi:hypothetical protein
MCTRIIKRPDDSHTSGIVVKSLCGVLSLFGIIAFSISVCAPAQAQQNFSNQTVTTAVTFDGSSNTANNTIFNASVDMFTNSNAYVKLINTDTFNDAVTLGTSQGIHLQDINADMVVGSAGSVLGYGSIVQDSGGATVTNNGTVNANSSSGSLLLAVSNLINNNLMEATNSGTLDIASTTVENFGAITADGGTVNFNGGTYTGESGSTLNQTSGALVENGTALNGDITITGTTGLTFTTSGGNSITGATITGNLDLVTNNGAYVKLINSNTFDSGTITLGAGGGDGIHLQDVNASLTVGNNGAIQGSGSITQDGGGATLTNNGTINANVNGNTLIIGLTNFNNTSTNSTTALA